MKRLILKRTAPFVVVLMVGVGLLGRDVYLWGKGALAGRLIERAMAAHLDDGAGHRPWTWSDFEVVARLEAPRLGVSRPVLTGASGESLAFGLGHVDGTARPGVPGNTVLAGHRDSWAAFMADLRPGDTLRLVHAGGTTVYRVVDAAVVDVLDPRPVASLGPDRLTLITCHPIGGLLPTRERYVITCCLL